MLGIYHSSVFVTMIIWTFKTFETFYLFTWLCFIYHWMKLLFFPPMTIGALLKSLATFLVACDKCATLPIFAKFGIIFKQIRFSSEILEIVCIHTLSFIMIMIEGTPFCLKVKDEKVIILVGLEQVMN